jgi:tRNA (adenine57-N1/adenine58-N1)-methyltransferase catalytic subunit
VEVLYRSWVVRGDAVRPEHQMVGHTGFLTVARRLADPTVVEGVPEEDADRQPSANGRPESDL